MSKTAIQPFRVALTADFFDAAGKPKYRDMGLSVFDGQQRVAHASFKEHRPEIAPEQIGDANGVIVLTPAVTAKSVSEASDLLAIGRFGVGYDAVDVKACTAADVLVYITAGAVDRSVAEATVAWMLAITHHLRMKDALLRTGQWNERSKYMGRELRDRTLGIVGFGGIGRCVCDLLRGWGMKQPLVFDPFVDPGTAADYGVKLVTLDELLTHSDFVSLHCPLNDKTKNLIGPREFGLMKPDAYIINTARGGIINEDALYDALKSKRIAGAALDCFVGEPITSPHRFGEFENVLLAPHCIAWTDELFRDIGRAVCQGMIDLSQGKKPHGVVNPDVLESRGFKAKWRRLVGELAEK